MATFTITTGTLVAPTLMDSLSGKTGDDTYNINGGVLLQDRDTRFGLNPSNSNGWIAGSPTLGGTLMFRSDKVRLLYFTGGTGNVPAFDTTISQGSASGLLLAVHSALNSAPVTPGSAMPSSGYIRLRQWNSNSFSSGALTGISATCAADPVFGTFDRAGWIIVHGRDSKNTNVSRINNPTEDVFKGDWFFMGITDGVRATAYQIPSNGDAMYISGVQVETAPGSNTYEWWPVTSSPMTATHINPNGLARKQCWIDPANAQIRFGSDGTNSSGGACPAAGCKVRVPNLFLQCASVASPTTTSFSVQNSRHYFYANGAGKWNLNNVSSAWRMNIGTNAYEVKIRDSSLCETLLIQYNATPYELTNMCLSMPVDAPATTHGLNPSGGIGGTATDCVFSLGNINNLSRQAVALSGVVDCDFIRCRILYAGNPTGAMAAVSSSITDRVTFEDCEITGWHSHSQSTNYSYTNIKAAGTPGAPIDAAANAAFFSLSNKCSGFLVDGWEFPDDETLGKGTFLNISGSSTFNKFRHMGSFADPISGRSPIKYDSAWTRSGTAITITENGHPYRVNDYVTVMYSSAIGTMTVGSKPVTAVTSNTFTVTGANTGPTSGTVTYYRTFCSNVVSIAAGCDNCEFQDIWVEGAYSRSVTAAAGAYGVVAKNVYGGVNSPASYVSGDMTVRAVSTTAVAPSAASAQYGHTFADGSVIQDLSASPSGTGVAWTRSGTIVTVTSPNHGMDSTTGTRIRITNSSDPAAMGTATTIKSATPLTKDTFTVTVSSPSGGTSGTLNWEMATDKLTLYMNEQSQSVTRYTIDSGTPAFTGSGTIAATSVGDQLTWEMPEELINYTAFPILPMETSLAEILTAQGAFHYTYDIAKDGGPFTGTFKNLSRIINATAGTSGTPNLLLDNTADLSLGDYAWGAGIAQYAKITGFTQGKLTMDGANSSASAPDSPSLNLTGSFTVDAKITLADWGTVSGNPCVVAKGNSASLTQGYYLRINGSGAPSIAIAAGSGVSATASASLSTVFTNGQPGWVRWAWDDAADTVSFYTSTNGSTWTMLGTPQALASAGIGTNTGVFFIGQRTTGNDRFTGDIYRVRIYSDVTQTTKVFDVDFADPALAGQDTYVDTASGNVVTTTGTQPATLSANHNASAAGPVMFNQLPNETFVDSFRLKVRQRTVLANALSNTFINIPLSSDAASRALLYPAENLVSISVKATDTSGNPVQNARVFIKAATGGPETNGTVLLTGLTDANGALAGTYGFTANQPITGWVRKATGSPTYKQAQLGGTIESGGFETTVFLVKDE